MTGWTKRGLLGLVVGVWAAPAMAQTTLVDGLGGPVDYGTQCLGSNDDGSSRVIDLAPIFPTGLQFFDRTHTSMYVNTNGNITFSGELSTYTPEAFPVADQPMIAPYWADVDIRVGAECSGPGGGTGYAGDCEDPSSNGVWWHLDAAARRVIVTWDRVGYYACHTDRVMSFQLILSAVDSSATCGGGGDFNVEFRFNRCEWNTGDASGGSMGLATDAVRCVAGLCPINPAVRCRMNMCGGVAAQSGFDAGNRMDFVEIMGSRTNTIHTTLCTSSNVGETGVWRFQIRSGTVVCPDAGDACDTGMPGVCAAGRTQCVGGGTECRPEVPPSAERCDALDNDCNGMVDDGMLCSGLEICDRGSCVAPCFEGGCAAGEICTADGRCVDAGCETVTCADGERCRAGSCVGACDGVTCPAGLACRGGRCVDLCAGAVCDDCTVCVDGTCELRCAFAPCPSGQTCTATGLCVADDCADVTCGAGEVCVGGSCTDACAGAVCPEGERCELGACVPVAGTDGGVPPPLDAGPMAMTDGGAAIMDAGGADGGAAGVDAGGGGGPDDGGCGCRAGGGRPGAAWLGLLALAALVWRRRR